MMGGWLSIEKVGGRRVIRVFGRKMLSFRLYPAVIDRIEGFLLWQVDSAVLARSGIKVPEEIARAWTGEYEVDEVRIGDMYRMWDGRKIALGDSMLVRYLETKDERLLDEYERLHIEAGIVTPVYCKLLRTTGLQTFAKVAEQGYDPSLSCVCVFGDDVIADGYHRCAALYAKYGPDYRLTVLRILPRK